MYMYMYVWCKCIPEALCTKCDRYSKFIAALLSASLPARQLHMYMYMYILMIFVFLLQGKYHVQPDYMSKQSKVNAKMRAILIDWLIQVHLRFKLLQETLYLTVSVIDRYLQVRYICSDLVDLFVFVCLFVCVCVCIFVCVCVYMCVHVCMRSACALHITYLCLLSCRVPAR